MRRLSSLMTLILVASVLLIGGVSAAWIYVTGNPTGDDTELGISSQYPNTYTIQFINEEEVIYSAPGNAFGSTVTIADLGEPTDNPEYNLLQQIERKKNETGYDGRYDDVTFHYWMNVASFQITEVKEDQNFIVKVYPSFTGLYTATFVDMNGNILSYFNFRKNDTSGLASKQTEAETKIAEIFAAESEGEPYDLKLKEWKIKYQDENGNAATGALDTSAFELGADITIFPIPTVTGVAMEYVDSNNDGIIEEFTATGFGDGKVTDTVVIPDSIAGKPVTKIAANAFSSYDGLHVVQLPKDIEFVGSKGMSDGSTSGIGGKKETMTFYYAGSKAEWLAREAKFDSTWDYGISENTKIYFLNGGDTVDPTQGYLQADNVYGGFLGMGSLERVDWIEHTIVQSYINTMATKTCDCTTGLPHPTNSAGQNLIPDYVYWIKEDGTPIEMS